MTPGIYNMTNDEYHSEKAMSSSGLKELDKSPAHFQYWQDNPTDPTPAMIFGTIFHMAILEPDRFLKDVVPYTGAKRGKAWESFKEQNEDRYVLSTEEFTKILEMQDSVLRNPVVSSLLENAIIEESIFWNDPAFDFLCKCRPDIRRPDLGIVADLKTCADASPEAFSKATHNYKYASQAAWYLNGVNQAQDVRHDTFLFICIEKSPPFLTAIYNAKDVLDHGRQFIRPLIEKYDRCIKENSWPGYSENIIDVELPPWSK